MRSAAHILNAAGLTLGDGYGHGEHRTECPRCDSFKHRPGDGALAIKIDDPGVTWWCHRCGWRNGARCEPLPRATIAKKMPTDAQRIARAHRILKASKPITGTIAEKYLISRGIVGSLPLCLRFGLAYHTHLKREIVAMIAPIRHITTNAVTGAHCTFLKADGSSKITDGEPRLVYGIQRNGAIKLTPDDDVTIGLAIAEGIETALSVMQSRGSVWSVINARGVRDFPIVKGLEALDIYADNDPDHCGLTAAKDCAERYAAAGIDARVLCTTEPATDWNDLIKEWRAA